MHEIDKTAEHQTRNGLIMLAVSPKKTLQSLKDIIEGKTVLFSNQEIALLTELNLVCVKSYLTEFCELEKANDTIRKLHKESRFGEGRLRGEHSWKEALDEIRLDRALILLAQSSHKLQISDLTGLGQALTELWQRLPSASPAEAEAILEIADKIKDIARENFDENWIKAENILNPEIIRTVVDYLVHNRAGIDILVQAIEDLNVITADIKPHEHNQDQPYFAALARNYQDQYNLEILTNPQKALIFEALNNIAAAVTDSEPLNSSKDEFKIVLKNPDNKPAWSPADSTPANPEMQIIELHKLINGLPESTLKAEISSAIEARRDLLYKFRNFTTAGELPAEVNSSFALLRNSVHRYFILSTQSSNPEKITLAEQEAGDAILNSVKSLIDARQSLNSQASHELRVLSVALLTVIGSAK